MGGRKLHCKNEERKKAMKKKHVTAMQVIHDAAVSIPRQITSSDVIQSQITTLMSSSSFSHLHPSWKIATADLALTLCKLEVQHLSSSEALLLASASLANLNLLNRPLPKVFEVSIVLGIVV